MKHKPSFSGDPASPRQPMTDQQQAAEWLRDAAKNVLRERDPATALDEAVYHWLALRVNSGHMDLSKAGAHVAEERARQLAKKGPGGKR